jgi:hypothetical protein
MWLGVACAACAGPERGEVAVHASPIIHGEDDRIEAFAVVDDALRELALTRAVAITARDAVVEHGGAIELAAPSLGQVAELCPGERFAEQPAGALCSGLLFDRDLVLTAGHCPFMIACDSMQLVIGYHYVSEGVLAPLDGDDVYTCGEVLASERSPSADERLDYAWIRLDRDVDNWVDPPIAVRDDSRPLERNEPLATFGFPNGTPLKVDDGAAVADPRPATLDFFTATTDSFYGSSGSPIFDAAGALVGTQNRGAADFVATDAGCNTVSRAPAMAVSEEQATYGFRALAGLCEQEPRRRPCPGSDLVHAGTDCGVIHPGATRNGSWAVACLLGLLGAIARSARRKNRGAR